MSFRGRWKTKQSPEDLPLPVQFTQALRRSGSAESLAGLGNADGGHAGGGCALDAHVCVFKDEAIFGRDAEARGGTRNASGAGLERA